MTIHACPKPTRQEKEPRKGINRASQKAIDSGELRGNSTFKRKATDPSKPKRKPSSRSSGTKTGRMRRSSGTKRKPRPADETLRIYGPEDFRDWLHQQPCAVCGSRVNVQQAHAKTGGTGRKDDWTRTFPACGVRLALAPLGSGRGTRTVEGCHAEAGRIGVKSFEAKHNVNLLALAALTQQRYAAARAQGGDSR